MNIAELFFKLKFPSWKLFRRHRLRADNILSENDARRDEFQLAGLSYDVGTSVANRTFSKLGLVRSDDSIHYEIFAAISQVTDVKNVLEIGTSVGNFTHFLSGLFPNARIQTWDLPSESFASPQSEPYRAISDQYGDQTRISSNRLFGIDNLVQIRRDSTFLTFETEIFDLIWIDGDHTFPIVAFDLANALRLVGPRGWICADDVLIKATKSSPSGTLESFRTISHLHDLGLVSLNLITKRLNDYNLMLDSNYRKRVAVMQRTG